MKKKRILLSLLCILTLSCIFCSSVYAESNVEYLENGCYIETTVSAAHDTYAGNTRSGSKTKSAKNANGEKLWSVTIHATFSYNPGISATCTSCYATSTSYSSVWQISDESCSRSGNSATATAIGTKYLQSIPMKSVTLSVTLSCDSYGNLK